MSQLDKYSRRCLQGIREIYREDSLLISPLVSNWLQRLQRQYRSLTYPPLVKAYETNLNPLYPKGNLLYRIAQDLEKQGTSMFRITPTLNSATQFAQWHLNHGRQMKSLNTLWRLRNTLPTRALQRFQLVHPSSSSPWHPLIQLLYHNNFISLDIHQEVETLPLVYQRWENPEMILHLYLPAGHRPVDIPRIAQICGFMRRWGSHHGRPLNLTFFAGNQKKMISPLGWTPYSINSGCSLSGSYVQMWRHEEYAKVLIHELIHFYQYDNNVLHSNYSRWNQQLSRRYRIQGFDQANEAYTDSLALLLHSAIMAGTQKPEELFRTEVQHSLIQASKILQEEGVKNTGALSGMSQTTSAFSYYLVKAGLLRVAEKLIPITPRPSLKKYFDLVNEVLEDEEYHETTQRLQSRLPESGFYRNTMRMSAISYE